MRRSSTDTLKALFTSGANKGAATGESTSAVEPPLPPLLTAASLSSVKAFSGAPAPLPLQALGAENEPPSAAFMPAAAPALLVAEGPLQALLRLDNGRNTLQARVLATMQLVYAARRCADRLRARAFYHWRSEVAVEVATESLAQRVAEQRAETDLLLNAAEQQGGSPSGDGAASAASVGERREAKPGGADPGQVCCLQQADSSALNARQLASLERVLLPAPSCSRRA